MTDPIDYEDDHDEDERDAWQQYKDVTQQDSDGAIMTRQTATPIRQLSMNATNRSVADLVHQWEAGYIDLDPPYQRGTVWTEDQRIALILSWLQGVPVPAAIINNRLTTAWAKANHIDSNGDLGPTYAVVDGKQRLETAIMWMRGDLAVPASWFRPENIETTEDTDDGPYVRYTGLTEVGRRLVDNDMHLPCAEAGVTTIQAEAEIYLLVNGGGTPQTDADMANAARVAGSDR